MCAKVVEGKEGNYIIEIRNEILYKWKQMKIKESDVIDLLNKEMINEAIMIKECDTVRGRLRRRMSEIYSKIGKATRHLKMKIRNSTIRFTIFRNEVINPHELQKEQEELFQNIDKFKYASVQQYNYTCLSINSKGVCCYIRNIAY